MNTDEYNSEWGLELRYQWPSAHCKHYYEAVNIWRTQLFNYHTRFGIHMPQTLRDTLWQKQIDHFYGKDHL